MQQDIQDVLIHKSGNSFASAGSCGASGSFAVPCLSFSSAPSPPLPPLPCKSGADVEPFVGDDTFYIPVTPEILRSIPRGKVPRQMGCSMRDWGVCVEKQRNEENEKRGGSARRHSTELPRLTMKEVMRHTSPDDLWLVVRGFVCDCTKFQRFHPGGERLLRQCAGRDCTALYDYYHPWVSCEGLMEPFIVGVIDSQSPN
ncbi:putative cytochrome b [Trypanosoma rangeli]|uniref:Putative cytochrome b n=1 Tax=Trypanosoma rangeli TaxID=5698 RepID=A0A422NIP5_TRYRA|nr:putative cytochrome b [Trypanosoma rangeli]RNF05368.1 putative cytochrome b [Trypanosoma rangeli]|eukprot:RNF05368.1 putative cytochrome b [Trypanosoma rangeli]